MKPFKASKRITTEEFNKLVKEVYENFKDSSIEKIKAQLKV